MLGSWRSVAVGALAVAAAPVAVLQSLQGGAPYVAGVGAIALGAAVLAARRAMGAFGLGLLAGTVAWLAVLASAAVSMVAG